MKKISFLRLIVFVLLVGITVINVFMYRGEMTVKTEVNDNSFQYALVHEAEIIWKGIGNGTYSFWHLIDSYNERWNEGFHLSTFYAHIPQMILSFVSVMFSIDSFVIFRFIKFLSLITLPLVFFAGAYSMGFPLISCIAVLFGTELIFTNGFYGIDSTSFLWRGWGLSSQLWAVWFAPLAFAYSYRFLSNGKYFVRAVFFNFCMASCHFGVFYMVALSYPVMALYLLCVIPVSRRLPFGKNGLLSWIPTPACRQARCAGMTEERIRMIKRLFYLALGIFIPLAYFIIPFVLQDAYRNYSYWDQIWKFNSFGIKQIIVWLLNGDLFDYNRLPVITGIVLAGLLIGLKKPKSLIFLFVLLFIMYLGIFAGRSAWGGLLSLIPGLSEFHLHRFIVMVQITGLYLGSLGIYDIWQIMRKRIRIEKSIKPIVIVCGIGVGVCMFWILLQPIKKYADENNNIIKGYNKTYVKESAGYIQLRNYLNTLPKHVRMYVGRPGNWGTQYTMGGGAMYMMLSRDGFPVVGYAPQSWSPNSEQDQFFNDYDIASYNLYNAGYFIAPKSFTPPEFAEEKAVFGNHYVYEVKTSGWFSGGLSTIVVSGKKEHMVNISHLWLSEGLPKGIYPYFIQAPENDSRMRQIHMIDEITYREGNEQTLWQKNPFSQEKKFDTNLIIKQKEEIIQNQYKAVVTVEKDCPLCTIVFRQTYNPNWRVIVNGKKVQAYPVFPYYTGIPVHRAGTYEITVEYVPNGLKIILFIGGIFIAVIGGWRLVTGNKKRR